MTGMTDCCSKAEIPIQQIIEMLKNCIQVTNQTLGRKVGLIQTVMTLWRRLEPDLEPSTLINLSLKSYDLQYNNCQWQNVCIYGAIRLAGDHPKNTNLFFTTIERNHIGESSTKHHLCVDRKRGRVGFLNPISTPYADITKRFQ